MVQTPHVGATKGKGGLAPILPERRDQTLRGRWQRILFKRRKPGFWKRMMWLGVLVALAALGGVLWQYQQPVGDWLSSRIAQATGATVKKIVIEGSGHTRRDELQAALQLQKGQSLVTYNTPAARARLEKLPWVRLASVERQLPDTLKVSLYEHVPLARVEVDGQDWVANKDGDLIVPDDEGAFASLPLLHGLGAPKQAAKLLAVLAQWPNLAGQLKEATWVGQRRWDLSFVSGVTVRLPEDLPAGTDAAGQPQTSQQIALNRLAELEESRHVLTLPGGEVDFRVPDRIVLRLPSEVGATPVTTKPSPTTAVTVPAGGSMLPPHH